MKIIKTHSDANKFISAKAKANEGCLICPCCGESKFTTEYSMSENKGILAGLQRSWVEGLFHMKNMCCDVYHCYTCGAEWESDPYEC